MSGPKDSSPKGFVEGTIPNDGDIMRFNEAKNGWEPYPFSQAHDDLTAGVGGAAPSSVQINIPFTDQTAGDGAAGRAGAANVKAVLVKSGNLVTMCMEAFTLDNSTGKFNYLNTDWDFDPILTPTEFPIPVGYRPSVDCHLIMPIISYKADKFTQGLALVGQLGYVEILPVDYSAPSGYWGDFTTTPSIHTNGYATYLSWIAGPAFT